LKNKEGENERPGGEQQQQPGGEQQQQPGGEQGVESFQQT